MAAITTVIATVKTSFDSEDAPPLVVVVVVICVTFCRYDYKMHKIKTLS